MSSFRFLFVKIKKMSQIDNLYNNPVFLKACKNLTEEDIQFFKDIQDGKIDLNNKKELKRRYKDIQLRMVSNFSIRELREFIVIMRYITIYSNNKKKYAKAE